MRKASSTILLISLVITACDSPPVVNSESPEPVVDPLAEDFFFMRNPEIREDLLEQLAINEIEFWINEDDSIGFYVKDTEEVDRLANEAIGVYISLQ